MKLWIRAGDQGYRTLASLQEVGDLLETLGVRSIQRDGQFRVEGNGFRGPNCFSSLYWGDEQAIGERDLNDDEIGRVTRT